MGKQTVKYISIIGFSVFLTLFFTSLSGGGPHCSGDVGGDGAGGGGDWPLCRWNEYVRPRTWTGRGAGKGTGKGHGRGTGTGTGRRRHGKGDGDGDGMLDGVEGMAARVRLGLGLDLVGDLVDDDVVVVDDDDEDTTLGLVDPQTPFQKFDVSLLPSANLKTRKPLWRQSSCSPRDDPEDPLTIKYGRDNMALMLPFKGSGERLRWFMRKLRMGEGVKVVVIGGSITHGHGVLAERATYGERVFDWIHRTYPNDDRHEYINGAQPGSSVTYFSFCFLEHVPTDADLVVVEFDVNAERKGESTVAFEDLFRQLLSLPSKPAVIYASTFALIYPMDVSGGSPGSFPTAIFYDIPIASVRGPMLPFIISNPARMRDLFYQEKNPVAKHRMDPKHMNELGHELLSDAIITLLREQDCEVERMEIAPSYWNAEQQDTRWPTRDHLGSVSRLRSTAQWSPNETESIPKPQCYSVLSSTSPLQPVENKGFEIVNLNDKQSWMTEDAESEITFRFEVTLGKLGFHIWGTNDKSYGAVACFIDQDRDNKNGTGRVISAYTSWYSYSIVEWTGSLWQNLRPGEHNVTCRTGRPDWGGTKFRIIGLSSM